MVMLVEHACAGTSVDIPEGDSVYLPREILLEDYSHLQKADIFSLGVSLYQMVRCHR